MNHMQLGILILNYKKYQVTADCIRSVLDTGNGLDYHIYVLDNGSGNDSVARLQALFPDEPRITWMESAENTGYARGNNQMLSRARKDGCTGAVITNSDIVFLPGTLQQLAADLAAGHPLVGPRLQYPDGKRQGSVKLRPYTYWEYLWTETYLRNLVPQRKLQVLRRQPTEPCAVYWLSGAVFAADLAVLRQLGDFDPYTFLYFEEYILSARCQAKGIQPWFDPTVTALHCHGASAGGATNLFTRVENLRSELYFLHHYWHWSRARLSTVRFVRCLEVLFTYGKAGKWADARTFLRKSKILLKKEQTHEA